MNTIIRKLFDRNFTYSRKILAMEPREVYAFVINNADLLRHTVREAMAADLEQFTLDIDQISKVPFRIPQSCLFTYDGTAKTQLEMKKNVYQGYLSSAEVRSSSERKFEKFCEKCDAVEWEYKNGDKGNGYLSIVYADNSDKQKNSFASRAKKTIDDIKEKFYKCVDDNISKDAGEYVVSELARETMVSKLDYLDIPLDELVGKKRSGNPGFDFHSQNKITDTVIFGEAKYIAAATAYSSALPQIVDFIRVGKDVEDLPELKPFCTTSALQRAADGKKGFSAAFSAKTTSTDKIIANIMKRPDFQSLLQYEELILVAVDL